MKGSIRRRRKDAWEITIDVGRDAGGQRLRHFTTVRGSKAAADRRLRELLSAVDKGLPPDISKITVAQYLVRWHRDYVKANTRPRTAERYDGDIRNHLTPHLGQLLLTKVGPADIQRMEATLLAKGLSPRSVQHAHRVLSEAFKHAVRWGLMWRNPCDSVRPPRQLRKEIRIPDASTVLRLLELAKQTPYHAAFHFLAYTGARRGEVCGLTWSDVDLERGLVSIRQAATKVRGHGVVIAPPKTDKGRRSITIDPDTVEVLRTHRGAQLVSQVRLADLYQNRGYVFASPLGDLLDPDALTGAWRRLAAKSGGDTVRLHDLRHFHASMLLQAGIHPKVVQERLGHSVISVTLDTYSHVVPGLQEKAASTFAQAMRSQQPRATV